MDTVEIVEDMANEQILVVDDEPHIVELATMYLTREQYQVRSVGDGKAALAAIRANKPDLVVLDLMLPEMDGYEVCRTVRNESDVPILMLTARDDDIDKIIGLEIGADDYMTKPFNPRELVARIKAILRRVDRTPKPGEKSLQIGNLELNPERYEVTVGEQVHKLRSKEFDLLHALMEHNGIVLSREQLLKLVWGFDFAGQTRTVDVHVAHLRKVLAESSVKIETVTGVGYKLTG